MLNAFGIQGCGARTGGAIGAIHAASKLEKWHPEFFDVITGDSFGSFVAAMIANNYSTQKMVDIYVEKDFTDFFVCMAALWKARYFASWSNSNLSVKMNKVADFLNNELKLQGSPRLFINTWDAKANCQIIYCEKKPEWVIDDQRIPTVWEENAYERYTVGTCIARSMCLPGLMADEPRFMDGGLGDHPALTFIPRDSNLLFINSGFAGLVTKWPQTVPLSSIDRAMYAYDVKAAIFNNFMLAEFPNKTVIQPKVYNYSALDLDMNKATKKEVIAAGMLNSTPQWKLYTPPNE